MITKVMMFLLIFVVGVYVLLASKALQFDQTTVENNEVMERVTMMPTFHYDRLEGYFKDLALRGRQWAYRTLGKAGQE